MVERSLRMRDAPGSIPGVSTIFGLKKSGLVRELNPGPRAPEARIIPLDQRAIDSPILCLFSSVVEHQSRKLGAVGSNPTGGKVFKMPNHQLLI